jgi:DNA polymerase (family 10)
VDRHVAALVLDEIAALLALQDDEPFRVRAYRTAARAVDGLEGDLPALLEGDELAAVPGLGPGTISVLRELVETGRSRLFDRLREETPAGVSQLRSVSGLGPKRVRTLHRELGIETLDALREAA